ncbi:MAG: glycoside hydrolase family 5 protein [Lachnospiraceae bacterium]|nr:glycoside hydrolase family 5 protein [Lachnospiraceae bacterium]
MLARVKQVVDWAFEADLFVIINIHHDNYDKNSNTGWINVTDEGYEKTSAQLKAMWEQIGNYFADYDARLIFEGMNEPRNIGSGNEWNGTKGQWDNVNKLGTDFVNTVRGLGGKNATRFLMVPCYAATSNSSAWKNYVFPENDDRVIMSIHAYTPYNFALNTSGTDQWTSQSQKDMQEIDKLFEDIKSVLIDKGRYAVIGEFGAMSKGANIDARTDWAGYYVSKAKEINIPVVWWDNNAFADGETFGLIRRNMNNSLLFTSIVEAMINSWYGTDFKFGK